MDVPRQSPGLALRGWHVVAKPQIANPTAPNPARAMASAPGHGQMAESGPN